MKEVSIKLIRIHVLNISVFENNLFYLKGTIAISNGTDLLKSVVFLASLI